MFISYRRSDSKQIAGRLRDRVVERVGRTNVFFDVDDIPPGVDFRVHINDQVAKCDVALVIIGPGWLDVIGAEGTRRLDDPDDYVRMEVEAALARSIAVVPVMVDGAQLPSAGSLPGSMVDLAYRNAAHVGDDPRFHRDVDDLLHALGLSEAERARPSDADDALRRAREAAWYVTAWAQWPDPAVRERDGLRPDEMYWVAYVRNDGPVPAVGVEVACAASSGEPLVIDWVAPAVPGETTWYILRDTERFPMSGDPPAITLEFTVRDHRFRRSGEHLELCARKLELEPALLELIDACEEYLQPHSLEVSDAIIASSRDLFTDVGAADRRELVEDWLASDRAAVRTAAYLLVLAEPSAVEAIDLVGALRVERAEATQTTETRPLWQLLVATRQVLRQSSPDDVRLLRAALGDLATFLDTTDRVDPGGECRGLVRRILSDKRKR